MRISKGDADLRTAGAMTQQGVLFVPPAYYQTAGGLAVRLDSADDWIALCFSPEADFELTSVSVHIDAVGTQGNGTLAIHDHDAVNDRPADKLMTLGSLPSGSAAGSWVRLAVPAGNRFLCAREETYWLVLKGSDSADFSPSVRRWHTGTGSMFPDGTRTLVTTDGGSSWTAALQDSKEALWNVIINSQDDHAPQLHFGRASGRAVSLPGSGLVKIPERAVALDCSTLTKDVPYNVYVSHHGGTLSLEASTTGRVVSGGFAVKSGDPTKRFLGMICPKEVLPGKQGPVDVLDRRLVAYPGMRKTVGKFSPYHQYTWHYIDPDDPWEKLMGDDFRIEFLSAGSAELDAAFEHLSSGPLALSLALDSDSSPWPRSEWITGGVGGGTRAGGAVRAHGRIPQGFHYMVPLIKSNFTQKKYVDFYVDMSERTMHELFIGEIRQ